MKTFLKRLPLPISGLMLALAATGNLLAAYGASLKNLFGLLSALICILLILKIITDFDAVKKGLEHPVIASVAPTFSMGLMILSTFLKPMWSSLAYGLWIFGLILHVLLIIGFSRRFLIGFNIRKVFASYFVVYVGIVVGTVTSPAYGAIQVGQALFWLGFISYLILFPIVIYRVFRVKEIPEPALPTMAIFSAPASLCLAGYMSAFPEKNLLVVSILTCFSVVSLLGVLFYLPRMLRLKFYPSYSAFTFPLVISAIALKKTTAYLLSMGYSNSLLKYISTFSEILAIAMVLYVLARYLKYLSAGDNTMAEKPKQIRSV